ncbi:integrase catalytic domain-containing protein [Trichonephila clavipes]|nr:integrase catalytic domain-containing protein [Trichonephila clavipes]
MSTAKFNLRGWKFSHKLLELNNSDEETKVVPVLGLNWNLTSDTLSIDVKYFSKERAPLLQKERKLTNPAKYRHIYASLNPADLPSRGYHIENLSRSRWWDGPEWLKLPSTDWPQSDINPDLETINTEKGKTIVSATSSLRRFIARRGRPFVIYSDNGTNLVGASNELKSVNWVKIEGLATAKKIRWKFNPPSAPWSQVHETTGYSSYQMLFGRDLRLRADFLFSWPPDAPLTPKKHVEKF